MELLSRLYYWLKSLFSPKPDTPPLVLPYRKKDYLLTKGEKAFFDVLYPIAQENNWYLFCKVRLEDLLWLPTGIERKVRYGLRGRVKSRHIDFVICDKTNIKPLCVIELDDSSHKWENRANRDRFVDEALAKARLPIVHVAVKAFYTKKDIETTVSKAISSL